MKKAFQNFIKLTVLILLFLLNDLHVQAQCYSQPNYCTAKTTNIANYGIGIQNVTLGTAINNTTSANGTAPNYFDFTAKTITAAPGATIPFSVRNGNSNSTKIIIFIDYNLDGTFSTSAPELVWASPTTTAGATVSDSFVVPASLGLGLYRIRVTGDFGGSPSNNPCTLNYGETEDYSLVITSSNKDALSIKGTSPVNFATGNNNISFSIANLWDSAISTIDIGYQLDNNSAVTESLSGLSLASGAIDTLDFTTQLNISSAGTYTLKMWINNVNGGGTASANNDTICRTFTVCSSSLSGTYTIDSTGSGASNFASFKEAIDKLVLCGISGPVVFNIANDTFYEQLTIPAILGASSTNTITFDGGAGNAANVVLFYPATALADNFIIKLDAAKYINFKNMTLTAAGTNFATCATYVNNASNDSFQNIIFNGRVTTSTSNNFALVFTPTQGFTNSNDMAFDTCVFNNGAYGIYNYSSSSNSLGSSSQRIRITRNTFTNQYAAAIMNQYVDGITIINNTITTNSSYTNYYGMYNYWIMVLADINKTVVTGNKISGAVGGVGIYAYFNGVNSNVTAARRFLYANNFIEIGTSSNTAVGLIDDYGNNVDYAHNSINVGTSKTDNGSGAAHFRGVAYGGNTIRNNIFATSNGATCIRVDNLNFYPTIDFNQYYTSGSYFGYLGGTANNNLSAWQTNTTKDANSVFSSPGYASNSDLHISGVCNKGTNLQSLVAVDIDGDSRSTSPNIGADENSNAPTNDVGIIAITSPTAPVSAGSQVLSAVIKNFGNDSISSITIYNDFNNTIDSQTFNFNPALQICDTATVTFTNNITIASGLNHIKVYTAKSGDSNNMNDTTQNTFCIAMSGSYTINSGAAASSTNFVSFDDAVDQLQCGGISGPVDFTVSGNTYNEQVTIPNINGSSSTNTISFVGTSIGSTILTYDANSGAPHTLRLAGCQYVSFRNMTIQGTNQSYAWVVSLLSSNHNSVSACKIECSGNAASSTSGNTVAVIINNNSTNIYSNGANDDNYIDSNTIVGGYYGVVSQTSNNSNINYIRNNKLTNSYYIGIYISNSQCVKILNNSIENRGNQGNSMGINLINANAAGNNGAYHEIKNNYINNVGSYGLFFQTAQGGNNANRGELYNNMIGGTFTGGGAVHGINYSYPNYWKVYNNSISIESTNASSNNGITLTGANIVGAEFVNNSIAINSTTASNALCMNLNATNVANAIDYNNYYNASGTNIIRIAGTTYDVTTYAAAFPNGGGANSIDGDPGYLAGNDLHASGSQLDNKGDASINVTEDFDGDNRSTTTPDIGADEYNSISYQDLSIVKLLAPLNVSCLGGFNQTITAVLQNVGVDTIDLSTDTAWVAADVIDPNSNLVTYGTVMVTGKTLYPQDTMVIDITHAFDMSELGNYNIKPYVTWVGDSNLTNNSLKNQNFNGEAPSVDLYYSKASICNGDTIKMSVANSKNAIDYQWFLDGNPIMNAYDSVLLVTDTGAYFCLLSNNSGCYASTDTIVVRAGSKPTASFSASKTTFCSGDSAMLFTTLNNLYSYQWIMNNTVINGATDTSYYAKTSGDYSLKVTETASGCSDITNSLSITAYSAVNASLTYSGSNNRCVGDSVKLSTNNASGLTYTWYLNNNAISPTDSFIYASTSGDYKVEVANSNGCKTMSSVVTLTFNALPNSNISMSGNSAACGSDTVYIDGVNNASYTYEWYNNGSAINGAASSQLIVTTNGNYTLKVTNTAGCSSTSSAINVTYKVKPSTPTLNGAATANVCPGDSMRISVSPVDTGSFTFQWKLNGSNINGGVDSFFYAKSNGLYSAEVINNGGCATVSATGVNVTLYTAGTPAITATGSTTLCAGDSVSLTAANAATGIVSVDWTLNGTSTGATANPLFVKAAGAYNVKVTDNNGCKSTATDVNVVVNPLPTPTITEIKPNSQLSTSITYTAYQWYLNNVAISGATTQTIRIFGNGDYYVEVTDANGCKGKSAVNSVTWYVGINGVEGKSAINVYPNPSHNLFNIELPEGVDSKYISVSDITGKQINVNLVQVTKNVYSIDMSNQASGVYMLQINNNSIVNQIRLIKF